MELKIIFKLKFLLNQSPLHAVWLWNIHLFVLKRIHIVFSICPWNTSIMLLLFQRLLDNPGDWSCTKSWCSMLKRVHLTFNNYWIGVGKIKLQHFPKTCSCISLFGSSARWHYIPRILRATTWHHHWSIWTCSVVLLESCST